MSKKRVHTKRTTLHFFVRNRERFPSLLETNNAFRIVTQTYFNSEHTIDFCVVKVFMVLLETKKKFLKLTKRPWVRNDYIPNKQRCILLLETNNTLRIFMVLSETKSALVIKISQRYCLLTVWNSDLFSICFFRRLDFFFRATLLKFRATWLRFRATWLRARWLSGDLTVNLSKYEGGRGETKDLRGRTMAKHVRFKTLYIS